MVAHSRERIYNRRPVLYESSFVGISVVRGPYLREIVKYSGIEPRAAPRAPLEEYLGIGLNDSFAQLIESKGVSMGEFLLAVFVE